MDQDYINKLGPEEKVWLSQFNNEYYGNTLKKDWRKNLHMKETQKAIYDQTNARNRDMYNKRYKFNEHESGIAIPNDYHEFANPEEAIIEAIDKEDKIKKFVKSALKARTEKKFTEEMTKVVFDME